MNLRENATIKNYLDQVKKKLPEWLKWKEVELNNVLTDLENQIETEVEVVSSGREPTNSDIQEALNRMGSPEGIAKLYKHRGTPKFYITEELFEFYLRSLTFFSVIVVLINIIVAVAQIFFLPWWQVLLGFVSGIWMGVLITAIVITIVFVYFSIEGFLPEDFGIIPKRLALLFPFNFTEEELEESKEYTKAKLAEAKQKLVEVKAVTKEKFAEAKAIRKQKVAEAREKIALKEKQPVSVGELISGAIGGIIFGIFLMIQPFATVVVFNQAFLDWLKLFGFLMFISGLFCVVRLGVGVRNYTGQQILIVIVTFYNIAYISLYLGLLNQPEIFPIALFSGGLVTIITADPTSLVYVIYFWIIMVMILATVGGMIGNFYKVYKLQKCKM